MSVIGISDEECVPEILGIGTLAFYDIPQGVKCVTCSTRVDAGTIKEVRIMGHFYDDVYFKDVADIMMLENGGRLVCPKCGASSNIILTKCPKGGDYLFVGAYKQKTAEP